MKLIYQGSKYMAILDNYYINDILTDFNNNTLNMDFESVYNLNTVDDFKLINSQIMNNVDTSSYDVEQSLVVLNPESINKFIDFLSNLKQQRTLNKYVCRTRRTPFKYNDFIYVEFNGFLDYMLIDLLFLEYTHSKAHIKQNINDTICDFVADFNFKPLNDYLYNKIIQSKEYNDIKFLLNLNYNVIMNYNVDDFKSYNVHRSNIGRIFIEITNQNIIRKIVKKVKKYKYNINFNLIFEHNMKNLPMQLGHDLDNETIIKNYLIDIYYNDIAIRMDDYFNDGNIKSIILIFS